MQLKMKQKKTTTVVQAKALQNLLQLIVNDRFVLLVEKIYIPGKEAWHTHLRIILRHGQSWKLPRAPTFQGPPGKVKYLSSLFLYLNR